jgi:hypothetical protein
MRLCQSGWSTLEYTRETICSLFSARVAPASLSCTVCRGDGWRVEARIFLRLESQREWVVLGVFLLAIGQWSADRVDCDRQATYGSFHAM